MTPLISICICTLEDRRKQLEKLLKVLRPQTKGAWAEIIIQPDAGESPIGAKRNAALQRAQGRYVSFVDDDDMVSDDYLRRIKEAANEDPDCIGITGKIIGGKYNGWTFRHSITVGRWCRDKRAKIFFRTPNHLNPIKKRLAVVAGFREHMRMGEDHDYANRVRPLLKTEKYLEGPIYYYNKG